METIDDLLLKKTLVSLTCETQEEIIDSHIECLKEVERLRRDFQMVVDDLIKIKFTLDDDKDRMTKNCLSLIINQANADLKEA